MELYTAYTLSNVFVHESPAIYFSDDYAHTLDTLIEHFENLLVSYSSCYWLQYKPPAIVQGRFLHSLSQFEDY